MSFPSVRTLSLRRLCWLLAIAVLASACRREPDPAPLPGSASEPATVVVQLAERLKDNDLVGYARLLATPSQYQQMGQAWKDGRSRWPLSEFPLSDKLPSLLATLSRDDAERSLQQAYDAQIAGQRAGVRQAVQTLGLFAAQYLRSEGDYSDEQRALYLQQAQALTEWASAAPLADRARAQAAIRRLVAAARATGLRGEADLRRVGMEESLRRLGPFLAALKAVLVSYGLRLDDSLTGLRSGLADRTDDRARVRIRYPLAEAQIDSTVTLVRRNGHWYPQRSQEEVVEVLAAAATQPPSDAVPAFGR